MIGQTPQNPSTYIAGDVNTGGGDFVAGDKYEIHLPPPPPPPSAFFTIREPPQDFTGRQAELDAVLAAFDGGQGALVSGLSGAAGVGKSALARLAARRLAERFPAARLEIDLQGASDRPLSPAEAMRRLLTPFYPAQPLPAGLDELHGVYLNALRRAPCLLLLDNARDAAQVRPLLPPPPSAALVTSRTYFIVTEVGLRPLRLDVLPLPEAGELLRRASPRLAEAAPDDVDALAMACGRLPLALRAAAGVYECRPDWEPRRLLARLADERTRLRQLCPEDDPDLDVQAVLETACAALPAELQARLPTLGVFAAPFEAGAAGAVWQADEDEAADLLASLQRRGLLEHDDKERCWRQHDLARVYAQGRLLADAGAAWEAALRHAGYYLQAGSDADDLYHAGGENVVPAVRRFAMLWPQIFAAWERLAGRDAAWGAPPGVLAGEVEGWLNDFPDCIAYVLDLRLPPARQVTLLERALQAARAVSDRSGESAHLGNLGIAYYNLGDPRRAIECYEQHLAIARETGDRRGEGQDLSNLGLAYANLGDPGRAIEYHEQALVIARETGDRHGEGAFLGNLGIAYYNLGDPRRAIECYKQHLAIARETGDRRGEGNALSNLGLVYADLGDPRRAIECFKRHLAIAREIGDRRGEGAALGNLGLAYAAQSDSHRAIKYYEQDLVVAREIGDRRGEGAALGNLGNTYKSLGDPRRAIEYYEQALVIHRETGDRRGEGQGLGNLGLACAALNDPRRAIEYYQQQLEIARQIGDRLGEANGSWNLGLVYEAQGNFAEAARLMQVRVDFLRAIGHPDAEGEAAQVEEVRKRAEG